MARMVRLTISYASNDVPILVNPDNIAYYTAAPTQPRPAKVG